MGLREDLLAKIKNNIKLLKEDCASKSIIDLENAVSRVEGLCVATPDGKTDAFSDANAALDAILKDCPDSADIIEKIRQDLQTGSGIKCGGP